MIFNFIGMLGLGGVIALMTVVAVLIGEGVGRFVGWLWWREFEAACKAMMFMRTVLASGLDARTSAAVWAIHSQPAKTHREKINKAAAIAQVIIDSAELKARIISRGVHSE